MVAFSVAPSTDPSDTHAEACLSPLDHDHLARQTVGDRALQAELLALFRREAAAILAALRQPSPAAEPARATGLVHTLCGSSRAVGFWAVGDEAERLERHLRTGVAEGPQGGGDGLALLATLVRDACRVCDRFLASSG